MSKTGRLHWVTKAVLAFTACALLTVASALAYRAIRQHQLSDSFAIRAPQGIDEARFVKIGDIDQWVKIRGEDRDNPVILIVHGGPGVSLMAYTPIFRHWEKYFTVVQWDQRGDGKTYGRNGQAGSQPMTIDQMTKDGIEVSEFLRRHLHKKKIVLLGHSWGSILGVRMAKARPDLFSAYVGTGQIVSEQPDWEAAYHNVLEKAANSGNRTAVEQLREAGPPPYRNANASRFLSKWSDVYGPAAERDLTAKVSQMIAVAPNYSLTDIYDFFVSRGYSKRVTYDELNAYDARKLGPHFDLPVFIFEGDTDFITPANFVRQYFDWINAPKKKFVLLHGGGHSAMLTMPDEFLEQLVTYVRPIAIEAQ